MATVFLAARRTTDGRDHLVVIKEMRPDLALEAEFRRMFVEEARLAAKVNHPNVVETFEAVEDPPGVYCIAMEFLDGQPLSRLRSAARREVMLPLLLHVARETLVGLEHVHAIGLVHRDVSPQNIFVTYDGDVKLLDFGVAKASDSSVHTSVGTLKGKLGYMSPEQVLGQHVDMRTDIFAMGVLLWEALVGRRLWQDIPEAAIIGRLLSAELPRAKTLKPDIPQGLDDICARAMARDRDDRYASAKEFREDLEKFIDRMTARPTRRHLAQLLVGLFSKQREALRVKIEEANAAHASAGATVAPPVLSTPPVADAIPSGLPTSVTSASANATATTAARARSRSMLLLLGVAITLGVVFGGLAVATRGAGKAGAPIRSVPAEAAPLPPPTPSALAASALPVVSPSEPATSTAGAGAGGVSLAPDAAVAPVLKRPTERTVAPTGSVAPKPGKSKGDSPDLGY